ncbi:hypothetical protein F5144DRAFT_478769 [Chaetomium tenue]|uniref:Uncharacterized protein n=1 Tax=Chaetomium tenue TaxID=1854479 RepID=A0ACB7PMN6_9PEZI|nr:hypothetical protein F5144DRAFT_478769 [Chaetomium globosum]
MSFREAYEPPLRQPTVQEEVDNGNKTPSIHNDDSTAAFSNGSDNNGEAPGDADVIMQYPARRTNIVSAATASRSLSQPQRIWSKTPQSAIRADYATADKKVPYLCASCGVITRFTANDMLRCVNCGGWTMHKPRVKQISQYPAN